MRDRTGIATVLLLVAGVARATVPGMLVSSSGTNQILKYDATTGAYEGVFISLAMTVIWRRHRHDQVL